MIAPQTMAVVTFLPYAPILPEIEHAVLVHLDSRATDTVVARTSTNASLTMAVVPVALWFPAPTQQEVERAVPARLDTQAAVLPIAPTSTSVSRTMEDAICAPRAPILEATAPAEHALLDLLEMGTADAATLMNA